MPTARWTGESGKPYSLFWTPKIPDQPKRCTFIILITLDTFETEELHTSKKLILKPDWIRYFVFYYTPAIEACNLMISGLSFTVWFPR